MAEHSPASRCVFAPRPRPARGAGTTLSADATLSGLALADADGTAVSLNDTFASDTYKYTASVESAVEQVTVTPTVNDSGASVAYDGFDADTNKAGHQVALTEGGQRHRREGDGRGRDDHPDLHRHGDAGGGR